MSLQHFEEQKRNKKPLPVKKNNSVDLYRKKSTDFLLNILEKKKILKPKMTFKCKLVTKALISV